MTERTAVYSFSILFSLSLPFESLSAREKEGEKAADNKSAIISPDLIHSRRTHTQAHSRTSFSLASAVNQSNRRTSKKHA